MMTIVRIDAEARWSDVVIHNNTLYYTGVPENLDADAFEQTANTLAQIDAVLEKQGSNKSSILDATIFLALVRKPSSAGTYDHSSKVRNQVKLIIHNLGIRTVLFNTFSKAGILILSDSF